MRLAIIPARSGSKRIPYKNVRPFCGRPMIAWSIEAALTSGCFDQVIVSTDDENIAATARAWGAEVPFLRPATLSDDKTPILPVIAHAMHWIEAQGTLCETVCCLFATAPFVRADDLRMGWEMLIGSDAAYVFTVTSYVFPIQRALRMTAGGWVEPLYPGYIGRRSQDLEEVFHDAGQFYWGRICAWKEELPIFAPHSLPLRVPRARVQDIDTPEDWERAEWLFKAMQELL